MNLRAIGIGGLFLTSVLGSACAQTTPYSKYNRTPWGGYPFPAYTDAEIAAPDVHRVLYQDEKVMLLEVTNTPGLQVGMHGHPYASVFARDTGDMGPSNGSTAGSGAAAGAMRDEMLDPTSEFNTDEYGQGPPPKGLLFPACTTLPPQAPHKPLNRGAIPVNFFRLEFRRLDSEDIQQRWKEWYPYMAQPVKPVKDIAPGPALGPKFSEQWPFPAPYDSIKAAPNNYQLLYDDGHLRLIEVTIRPGETTPMHGHPYPSVLAYNAISGDPSKVTEKYLDPNSSMNGQGAGHAPPPHFRGMKVPLCSTMAPQAPHSIHNGGTTPLHYYRMEFIRVDGENFLTHWQDLYPWMMNMKYMRQPAKPGDAEKQ